MTDAHSYISFSFCFNVSSLSSHPIAFSQPFSQISIRHPPLGLTYVVFHDEIVDLMLNPQPGEPGNE
jgi:hypothetical protein